MKNHLFLEKASRLFTFLLLLIALSENTFYPLSSSDLMPILRLPNLSSLSIFSKASDRQPNPALFSFPKAEEMPHISSSFQFLEISIDNVQDMNFSLMTSITSLNLHVHSAQSEPQLQQYAENLTYLSLFLPRVSWIEFSLPNIKISGAIIDALLHFSQLAVLRTFTSMDDGKLASLASHTNMQHLEIPFRSEISIDPFLVLAELTKLRTLDIFCGNSMHNFVRSLPKLSSLSNL